jgi:hypothetical protein
VGRKTGHLGGSFLKLLHCKEERWEIIGGRKEKKSAFGHFIPPPKLPFLSSIVEITIKKRQLPSIYNSPSSSKCNESYTT